MNDHLCYLNGQLLSHTEAKVSVADGGLLYGDGLFETMRIYAGRPYLLKQHLQRLKTGAAYLEIPLEDTGKINTAVEQVIEANAVTEGSLRLTLTGGGRRVVLWPRTPQIKPTLLITVKKTVPYPEHLYHSGYRAVLVSFPRNESSPLAKIKSLNFTEYMLGKREALRNDCDEGIFLNTKGELTEGTTSNLFIYDGKTLMTPEADCGLLPGISRAETLRLAREKLAVPVAEKILYRKDLEQAVEAFLTASIIELMPLIGVNGKNIGAGVPGPLTTALLSVYRQQTTSG
jgi:branched-chain amino acid aminotransferase